MVLQSYTIYQANLVSSLHGQWLGKNGQSELLLFGNKRPTFALNTERLSSKNFSTAFCADGLLACVPADFPPCSRASLGLWAHACWRKVWFPGAGRSSSLTFKPVIRVTLAFTVLIWKVTTCIHSCRGPHLQQIFVEPTSQLEKVCFLLTFIYHVCGGGMHTGVCM